ncbi:MAG: MGMT family protein [Methanobacteriota archaeon]|nr:MAG: MGMT family protein [Euryarchaeota archaeon]
MGVCAIRKSEVRTENDVIEYLKDWPKFERDVYVATFRIPKGKVSTYSRIARKIDRPKAQRAVANALHKNPLYPVVPCHRVVRSDGGFGGEKKAAAGRRRHVEREGVPTKSGKVILDDSILY